MWVKNGLNNRLKLHHSIAYVKYLCRTFKQNRTSNGLKFFLTSSFCFWFRILQIFYCSKINHFIFQLKVENFIIILIPKLWNVFRCFCWFEKKFTPQMLNFFFFIRFSTVAKTQSCTKLISSFEPKTVLQISGGATFQKFSAMDWKLKASWCAVLLSVSMSFLCA